MKVRQGFVSNSSTSSFVLFGAKIGKKLDDKLEEKIMEVFGFDWRKAADEMDGRDLDNLDPEDVDGMDSYIEDDIHEVFHDFLYEYLEPKHDLTVIWHEEMGAPKDSVYMGKLLEPDRNECDTFDNGVYSLDKVNKIVDNINKRLSMKSKGEILIGTKCC